MKAFLELCFIKPVCSEINSIDKKFQRNSLNIEIIVLKSSTSMTSSLMSFSSSKLKYYNQIQHSGNYDRELQHIWKEKEVSQVAAPATEV